MVCILEDEVVRRLGARVCAGVWVCVWVRERERE